MGISCPALRVATSLLTVIAAAHAAKETVAKATKPTKPAEDSLLEAGCIGCFPKNRKSCEKEVFARCCQQEINCHQSRCLGEVLGPLRVGNNIRVKADFVSDDEAREALTKGMTGRVLRVDEEGDAYIKFQREEFDDEFLHHWVFWQTSWKKLEIRGRSARQTGLKVVNCLDNCMLELECIPFNEAPKKKKEAFQKCMKRCKLDDCQKDEECGPLLQKYHQCKMETSSSKLCHPSEESIDVIPGKNGIAAEL